MKKLLVITVLFMSSCVEPVMQHDQYRVVDTLMPGKNGFGYILGYDVIIEYDSAYYPGYINNDGDLTEFYFNKIDPNNWKSK